MEVPGLNPTTHAPTPTPSHRLVTLRRLSLLQNRKVKASAFSLSSLVWKAAILRKDRTSTAHSSVLSILYLWGTLSPTPACCPLISLPFKCSSCTVPVSRVRNRGEACLPAFRLLSWLNHTPSEILTRTLSQDICRVHFGRVDWRPLCGP